MKKDYESTKIETYKTTNYDIFNKLLGNRDVSRARVAQIKKSIESVGYVINPIIVNEKLEIIDGQGRHQALAELGLPIYFQIADGAGIRECISMNIKMKNWGFMDYVISYKNRKYKDYVTLFNTIKQYKSINPPNVAGILGSCMSSGHNFNQIIQEGLFKVKNYKKAILTLDFISANMEYINNSDCNTVVMINVLSGLVREDLIDIDRMSEQLMKYYGLIENSYMVESILNSLQKVYNYKKKTAVMFRDAYIMKVSNGRG